MRLRIPCCFLLLVPSLAWSQTPEEKKATVQFLLSLRQPDGGFIPEAPNALTSAELHHGL